MTATRHTMIALRCQDGSVVTAEGGGGLGMVAAAGSIGAWQMFRLFNRSRSEAAVHHGDAVALQTWNGRFVTAEAGKLTASQGWVDAKSTFTVERVEGAGAVRPREALALRAGSGGYVTAEDGGRGAISSEGTRRGAWETFAITFLRPALVRLRAADARYLTAEGGTGGPLTANRPQAGLWETFSLFNLTRPEELARPGDTVALQAWGGTFVRVHGAAVEARANTMSVDARFRVDAAAPAATIGHGHRLSLRLWDTGQHLVAREGRISAVTTPGTAERHFTLELAERAPIAFGWVPDGRNLRGRPFEAPVERLEGRKDVLVLHEHYDGTPPIAASNDRIRDAVFGPAPSAAAWWHEMSGGVFGLRSAGVHGPLHVPTPVRVDEVEQLGPLLSAAENAGAPLASWTRDGAIDSHRVRILKLAPGPAGGQYYPAEGVSRRGVRFSGWIIGAGAGIGADGEVDKASRMVVAHELSHMFAGQWDRYGARRPFHGDVVAAYAHFDHWHRFVLERVAGPGRLRDGDQVRLRANNGLHVAVATEAPRFLNTEGAAAGDRRVFRVRVVGSASSDVVAGTRVTLQASTGRHVTAEAGGNSALTANRTAAGPWETFEIRNRMGAADGSPISAGDEMGLRTSGGFFVIAQTGVRRGPAGEDDTRRGYRWEIGVGFGGKFDNASDTGAVVMLSLYDRIRLGWARPRYLAPDNRGCYLLRPFLEAREALILFDPENPGEWYTVENRVHRADVDEVPSSGAVVSWICSDVGYWRWWLTRSNDNFAAESAQFYPAVVSAAAPDVPPNILARPVVLNDSHVTKVNDPAAAFTDQEVVLPLGNGDPSRFHLSFRRTGNNVAVCIR